MKKGKLEDIIIAEREVNEYFLRNKSELIRRKFKSFPEEGKYLFVFVEAGENKKGMCRVHWNVQRSDAALSERFFKDLFNLVLNNPGSIVVVFMHPTDNKYLRFISRT